MSVIYAATELALYSISGDDRLEWLSGQTTADLREVSVGDVRRGLFLQRTGRIRGAGWIRIDTSRIWVVLYSSTADDVTKALEDHIIMEDVDLKAVDDLTLVSSDVCVDGCAFGFETLRFGSPSHICAMPSDGLQTVPVTEEIAAKRELARILSGEPAYEVDYGAKQLPQEPGLGPILSFEKGCYLGQEPVVMLEHRGSPPRRLMKLEAAVSLAVGAKLELEGKSVGAITSSVMHEGRCKALGYVKRKALEATELMCGESKVDVIGFVETRPGA